MVKVPEELTNYLMGLMQDPYNKYCIDCKVNLSTHAIVFFGIFVCEDCCQKIVDMFGFQATYPKRIMNEHWDDF